LSVVVLVLVVNLTYCSMCHYVTDVRVKLLSGSLTGILLIITCFISAIDVMLQYEVYSRIQQTKGELPFCYRTPFCHIVSMNVFYFYPSLSFSLAMG